MTQISERKGGAILSYVWIALNSFVGLLFTPFLLRSLGQAEFGLYQLIGAFVAYLAVLDFGIVATLTRYTAKYREEEDKEGEKNFFAIVFVIYCTISAIIMVLGAVTYMFLGEIFGSSLTVSELVKAKTMFVMLVFGTTAVIFDKAIVGALAGYERFLFPRGVYIARVILRISILVALLLLGHGAVAIVFVDTLINVLVLFINATYAFGRCKLRVRLYHWDPSLIFEVLSFSFWVFLTLLATLLWWRMPQVLVGIYTSTSVVAVFAVAMLLNGLYQSLATVISSLFLPQATRLVMCGATGEELTNFMIRPSRYQLMLLGAVLCGFLLYGKQFITLWAGPDYELAYAIAATVMIPITVPLVQALGVSVLQAKNKHAFRAVLYLFLAICNTVASIFLIKRFGSMGAAIGTATTLLIGNVVAINLYYHYVIGINIPRFFRQLTKGILPASIVSSTLGACLLFLPGDSWAIFLVRCSGFSFVYCLMLYWFGINDSEKEFIINLMRPIKRWGEGLWCRA
jgi:O-antigen/teichoic acid export membrane protein